MLHFKTWILGVCLAPPWSGGFLNLRIRIALASFKPPLDMNAAFQRQRQDQERSHCEGIKPRQTSAWKTRAHFSFPQSTSSRLNKRPFGFHFYILNSENSPELCNHILLITLGQVWIQCRCFPGLVDCNNQVQHLIVRFPPAFVWFRQSFRMPGKARP